MRSKRFLFFTLLLVFAFGSLGTGLISSLLPQSPTFSTLIVTPLAIEGLAGDSLRNLYTTGRAASPNPCPVWSINLDSPSLVVVGFIPNPASCNPSGIAFGSDGFAYIADAASGGKIWRLKPNSNTPPTATEFTNGVPGTNGLAFDLKANLWTGDGTTGLGRIWKIAPCAAPPCAATEMFRIQPMRNGTALGGDIAGDGVGRQARTYPPGTNSTTVANPVATPPPPLPPGVTLNAAGDQVTFTPQGGQDLVANGVAFNKAGDLFVLDTARGAIWKATFDSKGNLKSETGCDTTFTANTLCLDNVYVAHPLLEGADGFVSDLAGNFWVDANERNAVVVVTPLRQVVEIFRSPPDPTTNLRNTGPLEFPTSPFISGKIFCTSNSDGNRRDNSPNSAGEINSGGPVGARGKISCMEEELKIPGLPLPIGSGKSKW